MNKCEAVTYITIEKEKVMLALEALERVNNVDDDCDILSPELANFVVDTIDVLKEALAKQEQRSDSEHTGEPVGYANDDWSRIDFKSGKVPTKGGPLYTTPQQPSTIVRTWVGLTDEEKQEWIDAMPYNIAPRHCMILVNIMEAKLKEKNNG